MTTDRFENLLNLIGRLEEAKIHYSLASYRCDAVSVQVAVPGERWEIDFLRDGTVDVEVFRSSGEIHDETKLESLFAIHSDSTPVSTTGTPIENGICTQ